MLCILPNTITNTHDQVVSILDAHKIPHTPLPWYPRALMLDTPKDTLTHIPEFMAGCFYLQNPSSLLPVIALDPHPGETILDLAAAPGGKTIHTAIRMGDTGQIIANDMSHTRIARMRRILTTYGVTSTQTICVAGQRVWMKYRDQCDRVLLDAPCSMQGTDTPSTDKPARMARLQHWLLRSAVSSCRPGGVIVYSTCTTTREENEDVIDWILSKDSQRVALDAIEWSQPILDAQILESPAPAGTPATYRVKQSESMEGFFVARLRRK